MANQTLFNMDFKEIAPEDARRRGLWRADASAYPVRVFVILKDGHETGMIALEDIGKGVAELSLTVFPAHRYRFLSRNTIKMILDFPFFLGVEKVIGWTKRESWKKVLKRLPSVRFMPVNPAHCTDHARFWYEKTRG